MAALLEAPAESQQDQQFGYAPEPVKQKEFGYAPEPAKPATDSTPAPADPSPTPDEQAPAPLVDRPSVIGQHVAGLPDGVTVPGFEAHSAAPMHGGSVTDQMIFGEPALRDADIERQKTQQEQNQDAAQSIRSGLSDSVEGAVARGLTHGPRTVASGFKEYATPTDAEARQGQAAVDPFGPPVYATPTGAPMTPQEVDEASRQHMHGLAKILAGGGETALTIGGPEMVGLGRLAAAGDPIAIAALGRIAVSVGVGAAASKGAGAVAQHYQLSPEAQELAQQAAFWTAAGLSGYATKIEPVKGDYGYKGVKAGVPGVQVEFGYTPEFRQPSPEGSYDEGSYVVPGKVTAKAEVAGREFGYTPKPANAPVAAAPKAPAEPRALPAPASERPVVQASTDAAAIRESAAAQEKPTVSSVEKAVEDLDGAEVVGSRVKDEESQTNKADRDKPIETQKDHLGVRIAADTPEAARAAVGAIAQTMPVVSTEPLNSNGLDGTQVMVQTGRPGEANQVSEIQVVPKSQVEAMKETDALYDQQKEALAAGDQDRADEIGKQITAIHEAALQPVKSDEVGTSPSKPPYEMSSDELDAAVDEAKNRDKNDLREIFGESGARRYQALQRAANGMDTRRADKASDEIEEMEDALSEDQRNQLFGIGDTRTPLETLKEYQDALRNLDESSPEGLAESLKYAASRIADPGADPSSMNPKQQVAFAQLRHAFEVAQKQGWDTNAIIRKAVTSAAGRFNDPEDAVFMLEKVVRAVAPETNTPNLETKPAERKTKFEFGNTQVNIPEGSDAHNAVLAAQKAIPETDLMGKGTSEDVPHVTVRYGLIGDDHDRLREFISHQAPFDATLGKTDKFPPTKNSDGAAVIMAPVESPELQRINGEIEQHADFKPSDFPNYRPHVTVAYVNPEVTDKYVGMDETEGKKFKVNSIAISDRNGNKEEIPLKGGRGESPEQPKAGEIQAPAKAPQLKTGANVVLPDGRSGVVKGISPKGDVEVKLDGGGRARANRDQVQAYDKNAPVEGVTSGTPGHEVPKPGAIAVDFDKTLSTYDGYKGPTVLGKPIAPMVEQVKKMLADGEDVWIYTARAAHPEAIPAIKAWTKEHVGQELPITNTKYSQFARFIDDRAELPVQMQEGAKVEQTDDEAKGDAAKSNETGTAVHSKGSKPAEEPSAEVQRGRRPAQESAVDRFKAATVKRTAAKTQTSKSSERIPGSDGKKTTVLTPSGKHEGVYRLVEANDLIPSHNSQNFEPNPAYPKNVQERDYKNDKASQHRVIAQAQNYDPAYTVNTNPDAVNGPPIVTPDGIVLGGNSRTMSTQRAYSAGDGDGYKDALRGSAQDFGFTRQQVDQMERPVLVREIPKPATQDEMERVGSALNKNMTGALTPSQKAVSAGRKITPETMDELGRLIDSTGDTASIRDMMREHGPEALEILQKSGALTEREAQGYRDGRDVSEEGKQFIENAILGSIVDDARLMDETPNSILNKLDGVLAAVTNLSVKDDAYDLIAPIRDALAQHAEIAERKTNVQDFQNQGGLIEQRNVNPVVDAIARKLAEKPTAVKTAFRNFAADAKDARLGQGSMFGGPAAAFDRFNEWFGATLTDEEYLDGIARSVYEDVSPAEGKGVGEGDLGVQEVRSGEPASGGAGDIDRAGSGQPQPDEAVTKKAANLGSTFYSGFADPELFKALFPDIAQRMKEWISDEETPGDQQRATMRQTRGEMDRKVSAVMHKLETVRREWVRRPRQDSIELWNAVESGDISKLPQKDQALAKLFKGAFDQMRGELQQVKPEALQNYIENYFPHLWERPSAASQLIKGIITGKRPFAGRASFLKKRIIPTMQDGLDLGLKPKTWNPVESFLLKYAEMAQFLMGHQTLQMMKQTGTARYIPVGTKAPEGWRQIDDRIGTVYGDPNIPVTEYFDKKVWEALQQTAQNILEQTTRKVNIGGKRLGYYSILDGIVTKTGTPLDVMSHELGHAIDEKYGLKEKLVKDKQFKQELRDLADLRFEGSQPSPYFKNYVRKGEEKIAAIFQAYVHTPERLQEVAPNTYKHIKEFLNEHPELKPLADMKKSLTHEARQDTVNAGGIVIRGYYYAPAEAAKIFNNFVSRGLAGRSSVYDVLNWFNQNLNALQLGVSAFHAATTTINGATSDVALGLQQIMEGKPFKAGASLAKGFSVLPSAISTYRNGTKLMREYLDPGSYAKFEAEAQALAEAGGRLKMNTIEIKPMDKIISAWRNGAIKDGLTPIPAAIMDVLSKPIMEYYVPRMKAGAFYFMAHDILDQSATKGWDQQEVRRQMQQAWDSVDNRFGQMVYDNLFWHKGLRDALQLATRSVGWNFGDLREIGGGILDTARGAAQGASGKRPEFTPRMAFAFAMPLISALIGGVLTYLWTGQKPQTWKDYYYPIGKDGTRHSIPGYMKDVIAFSKAPAHTTVNKMGPLWSMTADAINNRDFYGTEIRHKDDPAMKQLVQFSSWAGQQALPFSFTGTAKLLEQRGADDTLKGMLQEATKHPGDILLGHLGFQQAPASIQNTEALNMAREYNRENRPPGTKTQEDMEHLKAFDSVMQMHRTGQVDRNQIEQYVKEHKMTRAQVAKAMIESRLPTIVLASRNLKLEQILNVYDSATPEEKVHLRPLVMRKYPQLRDIEDPERRETITQAYENVLHEHPVIAAR